jgi:hypothetical protein
MRELDERLEVITSHIVRRLADAAVEDMRARYDFGKVLQTLKRGAKDGVTGTQIRVLAERLDVDPSALRRYARVSETISAREFAWMMRLRNARGGPLTWSHVELLARVSAAERRRSLAAAIAQHELSVRDLAKRVVRR